MLPENSLEKRMWVATRLLSENLSAQPPLLAGCASAFVTRATPRMICGGIVVKGHRRLSMNVEEVFGHFGVVVSCLISLGNRDFGKLPKVKFRRGFDGGRRMRLLT
jgi:hypothetical protein